MKLWIKLQHWFYRMLIDYKTKKIVEFNKEREEYYEANTNNKTHPGGVV
jgi:hypothetical protein